VEAYLAAVRHELGDLRPNERDDLLAEVEASLHDAAEESEAPIAARLGPPADFAAELRAAAGLSGSAPPPPRKDLLATAWRSPKAVSLKRTLVELAPIWWLARAYVAVAVLAFLVDAGDQGSDVWQGWSASAPLVPMIGSPELGVVLLLGAAAASIAIGLWQRRLGRAGTLSVAVNVALAIAALPIGGDLVERLSNQPYAGVYVETVPTPGLALDGVTVENVYPYSRDGRLMLDVLLYDQYGAPLNVRPGAADPDRRVLRSADGAEIYNSFPIRYFDAGTMSVARPGAAPKIPWSPVVTPPLKRKKPER
jgi:uncharacterized membrane protein